LKFKIGIDIGGTFTDLAVIDDDANFRMYKSSTTPENYSKGILDCFALCAADYGMDIKDFFRRVDVFFIHGSTIATNAVLERKTKKIGIICTRGHKFILWRRPINKENVFDFSIPYPQPLVPPYLCMEVTERINSEGDVEIPLNEDSVRMAVRQLKKWKVESIGVCLLWSIANDCHERQVAEIIEEEWPGVPYSLSSEVQPIIGEYHRASCVALNAMLTPIMKDYIKNLKDTLKKYGFEKEFFIVASNGGMITTNEAIEKPVYCLLSGPSMGPKAGLSIGRQEGVDNLITVDMGGTSFDISIIVDGKVVMNRNAMVGEYPTGVVSVEVLPLGAGGGSIAWIDAGGLLHVGPKSAGSKPGPACYGLGGKEATVTDANVILGYINPNYFLGGKMKIYPELSRKVIEKKVAVPLGKEVYEAAAGIYQVVNEKMIGGILKATTEKGIDPREFVMIVGGGAGPMHGAEIAKQLGIRKIIIPRAASVLCSMGMLKADIIFSRVQTYFMNIEKFDFDNVNILLERLENRVKASLIKAGISEENQRFEYYVTMRYPMQVKEIEIPLPTNRIQPNLISNLVDNFRSTYKRYYFSIEPAESPVEFVNWRVLGIGIVPTLPPRKHSYAGGKNPARALKDKRNVWFPEADGFIETPIYNGVKLCYGMKINGPAIIEEPSTNIVIIPNSIVSINKENDYVIEVR